MNTPKIYTRTGDKGKTSLIGGARVSKSHFRLDAYGTIDELNSVIGLLRHDVRSELPEAHASEANDLDSYLQVLQSALFNVGSQLACEEASVRAKLPTIDEAAIASLEEKMDLFTQTLKPLKNFILPGGTRSACTAHIARTVCRRAERLCVGLAETEEVEELVIRYINRMSDFLFVLARHLNALMGTDEPIWKS